MLQAYLFSYNGSPKERYFRSVVTEPIERAEYHDVLASSHVAYAKVIINLNAPIFRRAITEELLLCRNGSE